MRRALLALVAAAGAWCQSAAPRKALVIGNAAYTALPALATPVNDARAVAAALGKLGFQNTVGINRDLSRLAQDIDGFLRDLRKGDVGLFYYSGYALQVGGENYLAPVGFNTDSAQDVDFAAYSLTRVIRAMEGKGLEMAILILDASRQTPALARKFPDAGLGLLEPRGRDTLVAFSTLPRQVAQDPAGRATSLYTDALVQSLQTAGLGLDQVFQNVKRLVVGSSRGDQTPSDMTTAVREFVFYPKPPQVAEWEKLRESTDVAVLEAFRQKYPGDPLAAEAGRRVEQMAWQRASAADTAPALRAFAARYPESQFSQLARDRAAALERSQESAGREAVLDVIRRYQDAYQRKDMAALRALRPGLQRDEIRALEDTFRFARSLLMELKPSGVVIEGSQARVECQQYIQIRDEHGARPPTRATVIVRLRKAGAEWIVDSIH